MGVEKGDRIAVISKNSHPLPIIYLAAAKAGAVTVALNWRLKTDEFRYILEDCKPKMLFYDGDFEQVTPLLGSSLLSSRRFVLPTARIPPLLNI